MHTLDIIPGIGVGPIRLGMIRAQTLASLPDYGLDQSSSPTSDYAFGNSLQIEYGPSGGAQFIGVGFYSNCGCDYRFQGRHIGSYSAEELFRLLADLNGTPEAPYDPNEHYFKSIRVTVWEADAQYDYLNGETTPVYGQVGITNAEYDQ